MLEGQSSQPPVAIAGPCHAVVGWLLHSSDAAEASVIPTWPFFRALVFCATSSPMQSLAFSTCSESLLLSRLLQQAGSQMPGWAVRQGKALPQREQALHDMDAHWGAWHSRAPLQGQARRLAGQGNKEAGRALAWVLTVVRRSSARHISRQAKLGAHFCAEELR